jgi:predicted nucleotidyltransferase
MLTPKQKIVADQVIDEEGSRRQHLVLALSGSHAYGFPSPDSDLDLKAVHLEPTERILAMVPPKTSWNRLEMIADVEIDYTSNEIQGVLAGIIAGNGNYAERILGSLLLVSSPENDSLLPLVERALSRRMYRHYFGFASNQMKEVEEKESVAAKKVLYVLRTALTGTHLLLTGKLVTDLTKLIDEYGFGDARDLIAAKSRGERTALEPLVLLRWKKDLERTFSILEDALERSVLPEEAPNRPQLERWLLDLRRRNF